MEEVFTIQFSRGREIFLKALEIILKSPKAYDKRLQGSSLSSSVDFSSRLTLQRRLFFKNGETKEETFHWDPLNSEARFDSYLTLYFAEKEVKMCFSEDCSTIMRVKFKELCDNEALESPVTSLRLVDFEDYLRKYQELKGKYYKYLKESWSERTDPEKFIPEDLGIASYLILLWERERHESGYSPQTFIDLGCGNGLLVYILTKEGYSGTGVDIRKRKIWTRFKEADLRESTIIPSVDLRFPDYNWIIGNHSDELTPWIPVVSTLTSYDTKFFVLPCCPFEFTTKFQRRDQKLGVYSDYLNYVEQICIACGFSVERDRLRIPSTKRTCFIGSKTSYPIHEWKVRCEEVKKMVNLEGKRFKPRDKIERVKNCTQIEKTILNQIVDFVVSILLGNEGQAWNPGISISIRDLAAKVPQDLLNRLKKECGGLQTLLRNHHYIFFVSKGDVRLRVPGKDAPKTKPSNVKTKDCWFFKNHPQGCPVSSKECLWRHDEESAPLHKKAKFEDFT